MRRIGPCKVLEKYGSNAYKVNLPKDMSISPIFNVQDLIPYKGLAMDEVQYQKGLDKDILDLQVPKRKKPQVEKIFDSRVKKSTRKKAHKEHVVK